MPFPKLPNFLNPLPNFGQLLHNYRTMRGLTVEDIAKAANISPSAVTEIEKDMRPAPPKDVVMAMAGALGLKGEDRGAFVDAAEMSSPMMHAILGKRKAEAGEPVMPAAILVFLIADIRGYTRFTQEYGDKAAARLTTRFAEIARETVQHWGGQLVEMRGDEALAAFASAQGALHAAHALQTRCQEESASNPDLPLAIGVGLDLGEAAPVEGGFRGAALNRAARLCSLAGAGQVLVSTGVVYVAPHVDGVRYEAHGQEQLKGFDGPTPILLAAPAPIVDATLVDAPAEDAGSGAPEDE